MCDAELLMNTYRAALARLGLQASSALDGRGWSFVIDDETYLLAARPNDPEFMVVSIAFRRSDELADDTLAYAAINATNSRVKCAKLHLGEALLVASVELLVAAPACLPTVEHICAVLPRSVTMLNSGLETFRVELELAGIEAATAATDTEAA